jgi:hypothetical protein
LQGAEAVSGIASGFPAGGAGAAARFWAEAATLPLGHVETVDAGRADALDCAGEPARAMVEAAHVRLAAHGSWTLNQKQILARGLEEPIPGFAHLGGTLRAPPGGPGRAPDGACAGPLTLLARGLPAAIAPDTRASLVATLELG